MPTDEHCGRFECRDSLIAILGGFDALGDMLRHFVVKYESQPQAEELMAAVRSAKDASEYAAGLVRKRLSNADDSVES